MMEKRRVLLDWLKTATDQAVDETGTSRAYLRLIAYGQKTASPSMAVGIERATCARVTRQDLRPADWARIWPELANSSADLEEIVPPISQSDQANKPAGDPSSAESPA